MGKYWRKSMLYLGLGPDDEYEDYDEPVAPAPAPRPDTDRPGPAARPGPRAADGPPGPRGGPDGPSAQPAPRQKVVRPVPSNARPSVVSPTSFNHAQEVADKFKASQPVIVNLQGVDRDLARRLIDFASGICYGLGGHMERVASQVYLLTPSNVEVSAEDRRRMQERGYDG